VKFSGEMRSIVTMTGSLSEQRAQDEESVDHQ
jgi:hypothetical protein